MRRARGLRASSTRDICVFCATRQLATVPLSTCSSSAQQRQFNSSSRSPDSAEAVLYKDATPPSQPLSQAQRMRLALAASAAKAPPAQPQGTHMSPAQRMRASLASQAPQQNTPQSQRHSPSNRGPGSRSVVFEGPGRNQSRDRFAPIGTKGGNIRGNIEYRTTPQQNRYKINMDARPQVNAPAFDPGHLRRRNELRSSGANQAGAPAVTRPPPKGRGMLDQDEIAKLLNNSTTQSRTQYQPLARDSNAQRKCFHCGSLEHQSFACPVKPTLRAQRPVGKSDSRATTTSMPPQRHQESVADAAEAWVRKSKNLDIEPASLSQIQMEEEGKRHNIDGRRRKKFEFDEPEESVNRYEQPERRRGGGRGRRAMRDEDDEDDMPRFDRQDRKKQRAAAKKATQVEARKNTPTPISLPEYISVANLAGALRLRVEDFVRKLEDLGFEDVQNDHILNAEHAGLIAQEYGFEPIFQDSTDDGDIYPAPAPEPEAYAALPARPPVVTIMGHVDHGKTTILDYMRSTSVAATEHGGITQHIGAFSVPLANGRKITFLDTPGHAAFETMRARGANVTDIVVLVVAADDSVMPQTIEAIKHAQAAKVPMIVAINKIDKPQADVDAVKLDLGRHGIEIEDFGGDVQAIGVSGKTGQGIPDLEEAITTLSEMLDHRADPQAPVEGWVLEGTTKSRGRVATILVRNGTLRQGTTLVAGKTWTRVRTLRNEAGAVVDGVGPGMAVEVDGWRDQPIAGDEVLQANDEQHATSVTDLRTEKFEREQMARDMEAINEYRRTEAERRAAEEAASQAQEAGEEVAAKPEAKPSGPEVISLIIKGDVSGSVEAVIDSVSSLGNAEVSTRILRHGVGPPSEFDVAHAADAGGHIVNFNTAIPAHISKLAEEKGVRILDSNIIYRVVETVKELLSERLKPAVIQKVSGEAEIAALFEIGVGGRKKIKVAGSKVRNGVVGKGGRVKVFRGSEVVYDGTIANLKNQKKDVDQMRKDTECGISFADWEDFEVGDKIQCYEERFEKRSL
ncbi:similar to translation initiation factor IF-2 [Plenodomus lingam JN3]|uniref:Translation initiation factor IF-2, mitochondrial n=1 Tax=Leptosphaeria maculans (strain JN3 / isolate v23.1.3 / race Av1-4-5-6-7-8) TaxID=985895 RepID=E5A3K6_LEPMJ|nr:similar to translation initiation factor IF-2 [Plenodomus lingam JN3]CBX98219.1 similar to translation initiation factor IF-2 [Plenodomus lingam JN3]